MKRLHSMRSACCAIVATTLGLGGAAMAPQVYAQSGAPYPDKAVRFLVPYPPGGGTDVIARIVQPRFQALLGQPVLIDNRGSPSESPPARLASPML